MSLHAIIKARQDTAREDALKQAGLEKVAALDEARRLEEEAEREAEEDRADEYLQRIEMRVKEWRAAYMGVEHWRKTRNETSPAVSSTRLRAHLKAGLEIAGDLRMMLFGVHKPRQGDERRFWVTGTNLLVLLLDGIKRLELDYCPVTLS